MSNKTTSIIEHPNFRDLFILNHNSLYVGTLKLRCNKTSLEKAAILFQKVYNPTLKQVGSFREFRVPLHSST